MLPDSRLHLKFHSGRSDISGWLDSYNILSVHIYSFTPENKFGAFESHNSNAFLRIYSQIDNVFNIFGHIWAVATHDLIVVVMDAFKIRNNSERKPTQIAIEA